MKSVDTSLSDGSGMSFRKVIQAEIPSSVSSEESGREISQAYRDALGLAIKNGCGSVAFLRSLQAAPFLMMRSGPHHRRSLNFSGSMT